MMRFHANFAAVCVYLDLGLFDVDDLALVPLAEVVAHIKEVSLLELTPVLGEAARRSWVQETDQQE